jgi:hypothetical protein
MKKFSAEFPYIKSAEPLAQYLPIPNRQGQSIHHIIVNNSYLLQRFSAVPMESEL